MDVWHDVSEVPPGYGPCAVSLGNFDGVHRGHQALLTELVRRARADSLRAVVVTFDPHPAEVHQPGQPLQRLCTLADKLEVFAGIGVDGVLVIRYTMQFAQTSPGDFVRDYLSGPFAARVVVVGSDVRFGWRNMGDITTMRELGEAAGFETEEVKDAGPTAGNGRRWSSTWIREALTAGDTEGAAEVLGRWPHVRGVVVRGQARGRTLGFPTANLGHPIEGTVPADGVYAGWLVRLDLPDDDPERVLPAAISVGSNPTFGDDGRQVEAHVPGRDDLELYGERTEVRFAARIRHMLKFANVEDLIVQMRADVEAVVRALPTRPAEGPAD